MNTRQALGKTLMVAYTIARPYPTRKKKIESNLFKSKVGTLLQSRGLSKCCTVWETATCSGMQGYIYGVVMLIGGFSMSNRLLFKVDICAQML